jgi:hypothetical protein
MAAGNPCKNLLGWRRYSASMNYIWIQGYLHVMWAEVTSSCRDKPRKQITTTGLSRELGKMIAHPNTT